MGCGAMVLGSIAGCLAATDPPGTVDFDRAIRPILADACYACHGPHADRRKANLRLDVKDGLFGPTRDAQDPERDAALPDRIVSPGSVERSELARRLLADDPDERMPPPGAARNVSEQEKELLRAWIDAGAPWTGHWAFEPVRSVRPPAPAGAGWCRNEIDRFVLDGLEKHGLEPAPEAPPRVLLRRLCLDLTGLPPAPGDVSVFLNDESPLAYERAVDRLLASPRFGEHFAASWLDAARYADSNGFQLDPDRTAWPWRDWVVRAFNENMPYDRFVSEQIAGDLLPGAGPRETLATAFNRNHPLNGEGGRDKEESRIDYVHDRVDATATVFLGLTASCAQCHDHKYDPFTQRDYYRLFAFFNSVDEDGSADKGDMPPLLDWDPGTGAPLKVMVMRDRAPARETRVLERGAWDHPGEVVAPGTPAALPARRDAPPDRAGLAAWIVEPTNPLTARVEVNRLWQQLFGQGLVRTPDNFGVQGERPTHPELLDWLAARFTGSGWDVKSLLRLIVTSATYRQSSACSPSLLAADPDNRLLGRALRYRLTSAVIRDQALYASGLLVERVGGPPVFPYHPGGVWEDVSFGRLKYKQGSGDDLYRRTLYTFWRRTAAPANLFDVPQRQRCSVRVIRTNTPLQALVLLNDVTYAECAAALAERSLASEDPDGTRALRLAFEAVLCRTPADRELEVLRSRLSELRRHYAQNPDEAAAVACAGERPDPPQERRADIAAMAGVVAIILNLDEAITRE